ncbi:sulfite exporter TauE/SafE family protein [Chitinophaga sp.]|uniref:sulfite exporter TauE/SafE family protein n=1 Tax=Chitinophaga sp. TaxID=1869181 RepID=UPI002F931A0A
MEKELTTLAASAATTTGGSNAVTPPVNGNAPESANFRKQRWIYGIAGILLLGIILGVAWWQSPDFRTYVEDVPPTFYYFLVAGFIFAMIDGAIGMSYGITSTTFSLSMGIPPASASTAVHISEILSCGIAGWMHMRMGNVNKKLFRMLILPGIAGAMIGAYLLSSLEHYAQYTKPVVSLYTLILGTVILMRAINVQRKKHVDKKIKRIGLLGFGGGFIDAIGGGGWGSIVLSSLIAGGRHPRFSLGTVKATRFFIAMLSSLTFVTVLYHVHWDAVLGLVIGSAIASPIAAKVSNKISAKTIMVAVAIIVILASIRSIFMFVHKII